MREQRIISKKSVRGEKRKCQNEDCAMPFYDLNRKEFDCPICGSTFDLELHAAALAQKRNEVPDYIRRRQSRDLPVVASVGPVASDTAENETTNGDEPGDGGIVAESETAAAEAANILLEQDEDEYVQAPLKDAVPMGVVDKEEN